MLDGDHTVQIVLSPVLSYPAFVNADTASDGIMSAILSADDLNDFISPGVACIKPVETLPLQKPQEQDVCSTCHPTLLLC